MNNHNHNALSSETFLLISNAMIEAAAEVLLNSPHCELSQGFAEDLAEEMLRVAANMERVESQTG